MSVLEYVREGTTAVEKSERDVREVAIHIRAHHWALPARTGSTKGVRNAASTTICKSERSRKRKEHILLLVKNRRNEHVVANTSIQNFLRQQQLLRR